MPISVIAVMITLLVAYAPRSSALTASAWPRNRNS
jgi:hypothetical protein